MRLTVGLLACLSMIGLSQAMAADPTPASAAASAKALPATAVSSSEAPAAGMPAAPSSATSTPSGSPTGTPAAAPAATAGGSPDKSSPSMTDVDKKLRAQGYKVETHGSQKVYCRIEPIIGSRFDKKVCATPEQMAEMQQNAAHDTDKMQTHHSNWLKGG
jgi:hypothetical protein